MPWWLFGRKRKSNKSEKPERAEPQPSVVTEKRQAPQSAGASRRSRAQPKDPFSDPTPIEKVPATLRVPQASQTLPQTRSQAQHHAPRPRTPPPEPIDEEITALPRTPRRAQSPHTQTVPILASSQRPEEPTLVRRKSSKRRRDDKSREDEIRAMTANFPSPTQLRPGTASKASRASRPHPNPTSTVSLPVPRSNRSSMSALTEPHLFDLGAVDILSPRPTLRYSVHGNYASSAVRSSVPSRSGSWREKRPVSRPTIEESDTIDEFADTMDARTMRELMDREQRRRDRKRRTDQDRARRRLDRLAARGEADTDERRHRSRRKEADVPAIVGNAETGSSGLTKEYGPANPETLEALTRKSPAQDPFADPTDYYEPVDPPEAIRSMHPEPIPTIPYDPTNEDMRPISPLRVVGHYRHTSNLSQSTDPRNGSYQDLSQTSSIADRPSESTTRRGGALAALFRRSGLYKRETPVGQAFSNTSRESMGRHTPPPDMHERTYRRGSSGVPMRTRSKFREDLPGVAPGTGLRLSEATESEHVPPLPSEIARNDGPEAVLEPALYQRASYDSHIAPSAALLSQSLASVDSEASWLSGGRSPRKRTSQQMSLGGRSSFARASALSGRSTDDLGLYEEPSARRSYGVEHPSGLGNTSTVMSADDYSEHASAVDEEVNQGTVSRRPTVVHRQPRVHSSEGLLRQFSDESAPAATSTEETDVFYDMSDHGTPGVTTPDQAHPYQQATQAYGLTHARSISAGSARLLDIPARSDSRRSSNRTSSPVL